MNIALFAYNFPHKKTQDFLIRLFVEDRTPKLVLAANSVELSLPRVTTRTKPRFDNLLHPRRMAEKMGVPYYVVAHDSRETRDLLGKYDIDVAVIAGARILRQQTISAVSIGIINFHPGLIPEARGLNALERSILRDLPLAVTAHFIDSRMDAGRIILRRRIQLFQDDTILDASLRLSETETLMLPEVLALVERTPVGDFEAVSVDASVSATPLQEDELRAAKIGFGSYLSRHCKT